MDEDCIVDFKIKYGFLYVFVNPSFPKWVKIGRTNNIDRRIRELNTAVPTRFILHKAWVMNDEVTAERIIHNWLEELRSENRSEFFNISHDQHSDYCEEYGLENYVLDYIVDQLEHILWSNGIPSEHAWHPHLEG